MQTGALNDSQAILGAQSQPARIIVLNVLVIPDRFTIRVSRSKRLIDAGSKERTEAK